MWGLIEETGKYLRVVTLADGETIHNAFFDRRFKEDETSNSIIIRKPTRYI